MRTTTLLFSSGHESEPERSSVCVREKVSKVHVHACAFWHAALDHQHGRRCEGVPACERTCQVCVNPDPGLISDKTEVVQMRMSHALMICALTIYKA